MPLTQTSPGFLNGHDLRVPPLPASPSQTLCATWELMLLSVEPRFVVIGGRLHMLRLRFSPTAGVLVVAALLSHPAPARAELFLQMHLQSDANGANIFQDYYSPTDPAYSGGPQLSASLGTQAVASIDGTTGSLKVVVGDTTQGVGGAVAVLTDQLMIAGASSPTVTVTIHAAIDRTLQLAASPPPADEGEIALSAVRFDVYPSFQSCLSGSCCLNCDGTGGQLVESRLRIIQNPGAPVDGPQHYFHDAGLWRTFTDEGPGFGPVAGGGGFSDDITFTREVATDEGFGIFARIIVDAKCGTSAGTCIWLADASHSAYLEITSSEGTVVSQSGYHYLGRSGTGGTTSTTTTLPACTTARCVLDGARHGAACADQSLPGKVSTKIDQAVTSIEAADHLSPKKISRSLRRARTLLNAASGAAAHAAKGHHAKLSRPCADVIRTAVATVVSGLPH